MLTPQQKYDRSAKGLARSKRATEKHIEKKRAQMLERYHFPEAQECSIKGCGKNGERHHSNYKHKTDIIWLCREHHRHIHGKARGKCRICEKLAHGKGLCHTHYQYWRRTGKEPDVT